MKTLADLKRDIVPGVQIECTDFVWCARDGRPEERGVSPRMAGVRTVEHKNTVGFVVNGSHFDWPKADELQYDGDTIVVSPKDQHGEVYQVRTYKIIE